MANEFPVYVDSFEAAEDLSSDRYRFVVLNSSGKVRRPDSANEHPLGVLQNAPASGEGASVMIVGRSKLHLGGTVTPGQEIKHEYVSAADAGKGTAATGGTDIVMGRCVQGGDEGDLGSIILTGGTRYNHTTTTTTTA